jgi:MFS family permease
MTTDKATRDARRSIKLIFAESALTNFSLVMPVIWLIYADVGLSQFDIGLAQAFFAATMLITMVPTGYIADRFSRKLSNMSGDLLMAVGLVVYGLGASLPIFILAEVLFGLGLSLTRGADKALLKAHCAVAKKDYNKTNGRLESVNFALQGAGAVAGGILGAQNIRWPLFVTAGIFMLGFFVSTMIKNAGKKRETDLHPLRDISNIVRYCLNRDSKLAWRIFLGSSLLGSTWMIVWLLTPLFLQSDIAIGWHGVLFAAISVAAIGGSELARKVKMPMTLPLLITGLAYLVLGIHVSIFTAFLYLVTSFSRGINTAKVQPYIQEDVPEDIQATALSVFDMSYRVVTIVLGLSVNFLASINLQLGFGFAAVFSFVCFGIFTVFAHKYE